ncbi:MAG: ribonuclease III [Thermodesulfobacteriota bacterium]
MISNGKTAITPGRPSDERREQLAILQERLGYVFQEPELLHKALIHSSFAYEQAASSRDHNETLEFLGDAVLDLVIGDELFRRFPDLKEGDLTRCRAALVNEGHLATVARAIGLGGFLCLGKGEEASAGREKASILAGAFEAVCGAVYLDGGFVAAQALVQRQFDASLASVGDSELLLDAKSRLQELIQEREAATPEYLLEQAEGPDHQKIFTVSVRLGGRVLAFGRGRSKKEAEQQAAAVALAELA